MAPIAVTAVTSISKHPSSSMLSHGMQLALLLAVLLFAFVSAYFGLFNEVSSGSGKEKFANFSMVNGIL
jgi:hypothetical protein